MEEGSSSRQRGRTTQKLYGASGGEGYGPISNAKKTAWCGRNLSGFGAKISIKARKRMAKGLPEKKRGRTLRLPGRFNTTYDSMDHPPMSGATDKGVNIPRGMDHYRRIDRVKKRTGNGKRVRIRTGRKRECIKSDQK